MNLEGRALFEKAAELEREGTAFLMCTVVQTEGSTPRKAGTHMIVTGNGENFGTVGGGRVEHICLEHAVKIQEAASSEELPQCLSFNMNSADNEGLVCGGKCTVVFWKPEMETGKQGFFSRLLALAGENKGGWLVLDFRKPENKDGHKQPWQKAEDDPFRKSGPVSCGCYPSDALPEEYGPFMKPGLSSREGVYFERLFTEEHAYLIGGGHVGQALSPVLKGLGFKVTVVDDRSFVKDGQLFPDADEVICCSYGSLKEHITITENDYVVVTTFGHKGDLETLKNVLPARPKYLGCIGSKKKAAYISGKLKILGFDQDLIGSIHSPVGLSIGAETPEEIAVSIAAEIIAVRRHMIEGRGLPLSDPETVIHTSENAQAKTGRSI